MPCFTVILRYLRLSRWTLDVQRPVVIKDSFWILWINFFHQGVKIRLGHTSIMEGIQRLTAVLVLSLFSVVLGFRSFQLQIPNGDKVKHPCQPGRDWPTVGHANWDYTPVKNLFGEVSLHAFVARMPAKEIRLMRVCVQLIFKSDCASTNYDWIHRCSLFG